MQNARASTTTESAGSLLFFFFFYLFITQHNPTHTYSYWICTNLFTTNRATTLTMKRSCRTSTAISGRLRCDSRPSTFGRSAWWVSGSSTLSSAGLDTPQSLVSISIISTTTIPRNGHLPLLSLPSESQCKRKALLSFLSLLLMQDFAL